jgi:hypothetical protein
MEQAMEQQEVRKMISPATGRRFGHRISWSFREPTIAEMFSDSIVMAVMKADGVDPVALEAQLRGMAVPSAVPLAVPPAAARCGAACS